ncbi:helix-turn-helix transcriptional regulator [Streptomyces longispororuber]|uniref:helix-turn-helix transcriptional regulator n=1 Tax=Streptomyces longispororuber TaxID=68230 RepID=UPI0036F6C8C7
MARVHQLTDTAGPTALEAAYTAYYASIAHSEPAADGTVRHRLRRGLGEGTIEVTALHSGFALIRYDVAFTRPHHLRYAFTGDHFELEHCLEGDLRVSDAHTGSGHLRAGAVALSPHRPARGVLTHPAGRRYRALSLTGTWSGLAAHLAHLGIEPPPDLRPALTAHRHYLSGSASLRPAADPLRDLYLHRRTGPGRRLVLESRLACALSTLLEALAPRPAPAPEGHLRLERHEVDALHRVPGLLWQHRHDPLTLAQVARATSMSVKRLNAGFRALYGTSVGAYHRRRCLERAAALLVETDWPVARIGHEVGYASATNFTYAFRRARGTTPTHYRRTHT